MTSVEDMISRAAGIGADGHPVEQPDSLLKLLDQRRFKPDNEPPPIRAFYTLNAQVIATPGNLAAITAAIKTGKTAVIGAMEAAVMAQQDNLDLLGFRSSNPGSYALLHFDSEQSPDDHWHQVQRALKRAQIQKPPNWFYSYCLTGLGCKQAWECVQQATRTAAEMHGGVHSVLIDGIADFVRDVNDPGESNDFIAALHDMAIQNDCPIIGVIHFNPGGDKVRGHLGSQLERKAETNLRLDKVDDVTTIWSDKQRRAPIPKDLGPCFQWSEEHQMHVSVQNRRASKAEIERETLSALAQEIFSERPAMSYSDLATTLKDRLRVSLATAERRVARLHQLGLIKKSVAGLYVTAT